MSHIRSQAHGTLISLPVSYPCVYIVSMSYPSLLAGYPRFISVISSRSVPIPFLPMKPRSRPGPHPDPAFTKSQQGINNF